MKKIFVILSIFILFACQQSAPEGTPGNTNSTSNSSEKVLKLWLDNDPWAQAVIEDYQELHPDVRIEYEKVGAVDARAKLELDGPAGLGADVFLTPHDGVFPTYQDGHIARLPDDLSQDIRTRFLDPSVGTVDFSDGMYGVPLSVESIALFYNKALVPNGVPHETFEELIEWGRTYLQETGQTPIRINMADGYITQFILDSFGFQIFGPNHDDPQNPGWDSENTRQALEWIMNSLKPIYPIQTADMTWDTIEMEFPKGNIPYIITGPWAIKEIESVAEQNGVELDFGVSRIPTIQGKNPKTFAGNIVMQVSEYSKNKELAFDFLRYASSDRGLTTLYENSNRLPALKDASVIPGVVDDDRLLGILAQAEYSIPMPYLKEMTYAWDPQMYLVVYPWDGQLSIPDSQTKAIEDYFNTLALTGE